MAVSEWACRIADKAAVAVGVVLSFLSGVADRAGTAAAVHTPRDRANLPAFTELLGSGSLFPISHLHVIFGIEVVIATKTLRFTHECTGYDDKCYTAPVVVHLHPKVCLNDSKPAACVKLELVAVQCCREVGELTIDLYEKAMTQKNVYKVICTFKGTSM